MYFWFYLSQLEPSLCVIKIYFVSLCSVQLNWSASQVRQRTNTHGRALEPVRRKSKCYMSAVMCNCGRLSWIAITNVKLMNKNFSKCLNAIWSAVALCVHKFYKNVNCDMLISHFYTTDNLFFYIWLLRYYFVRGNFKIWVFGFGDYPFSE